MTTKQQIGLGMFIAGTSLIAFPFFTNEWFIYGLIVVFAAGGAMVTPNLLSAVSLLLKKDTGRNISIQSSTKSIGQILGPILGISLIGGPKRPCQGRAVGKIHCISASIFFICGFCNRPP